MKKYDIDPADSRPNIIKEPMLAYLGAYSMRLDTERIVSISDSTEDKILQELIDGTGLTQHFLAVDVFEITPKTFAKYKQGGTVLPARIREIAIKLIYLFEVGRAVFITNDDFIKWLQLPAYGLDGRIPAQLLKTATGIDMIEDLVHAIEYGATA